MPRPPAPAPSPAPADGFLRRHAFALGLAAIVVAGALLRLWRLGEVPFGFHTDEGHYAMDGWRIVQGARPVFLERNNGREPLFVYFMALLFALAGPSIATARLTAALAGLAAILAQALWVRELPLARPRRVALLSAGFLALGFWPVAQGRYGLRTSLMAVPVSLMLWAWWRAIRPMEGPAAASKGPGGASKAQRAMQDRPGGATEGQDPPAPHPRLSRDAAALLAGLFLAAGVYTYLTGRLLPAILLVSALWALVVDRDRRAWRPLVLALVLGGLLSLPLVAYFVRHPELFSHRTDQVSILSPEVNDGHPLRAFLENGWRLVQMPLVRGDSSWYHNIKRRPVFSEPIADLAFLAGLVVLGLMLAGRRGAAARAAAVLVAATALVTLAPSWLSQGAPNYVRLTGLWPPLYLVPALGLDALAARLEVRGGWLERRGGPRTRLVVPALLALTLAWTGWATARDYFQDYAPRPEVYEAFNGAAVERGNAIARQARPVYVSPALAQQSVIQFLNLRPALSGSPALDRGLILPPRPWTAGARYLFDPVEADSAAAFARRWPEARRQDIRLAQTRPATEAGSDDTPTTANLIAFSFDAAGLEALTASLAPRTVVFGGLLRLERWGLRQNHSAPGQTLRLRLLWSLAAPHDLDHNFFVHVVAADGRGAAQFDGPPLGLPEGGSSHPSNLWLPGEQVLQEVDLQLAADTAPGEARILHGWYDWRTGARLPVPGNPEAAVELGRVQIAPLPGAGAGG